MDFPNPQEYPYLFKKMVQLTEKAQQKRQDREIEAEFGRIDEAEEEWIWREEQRLRI